MAKFIFVTGGVMSGLGKGVVSSSIAKLLQLSDQRVSCVKIDPYLNYDAGTMNPIAHGEVFVTEDGGECDMDVGNYERFLNQDMPKSHNITTSQVYSTVIEKERRGDYLGACVQIIPHVTEEIKSRIRRTAEEESLDMLVVECGGTVGDIESLPFLEALRQIRVEDGPESVAFVHVTLAPSIDAVGEQKTKPTQHSVQELRRIGIQPDYVAVRCEKELEGPTRKKIALFTNVPERDVLSCHDVGTIFRVPHVMYDQGIVDSMFKKFGKVGLVNTSNRWADWTSIVDSLERPGEDVKIAMVGKYVDLPDSYVSVNLALRHAGASIGRSVSIDWIDSETLREGSLGGYGGIIVPGGFGTRGAEGIIAAAEHARATDTPYLGICFGFQLAAVAFARGACGMGGATSSELDSSAEDPVVGILPGQEGAGMGGSLRLGAHEIELTGGSRAEAIYGARSITRRHRHRYEFNLDYRGRFAREGMVFSGQSDSGRRMEVLEIPSLRFFVGVQFHPEFSSRPGSPEGAFGAFVSAAAGI
ncbi:MAG: CTP synthase [Thaumarchaeota archaeon]|nr:CTP synthase [Nitrososphaerota archaeon]MDD9814042.1 CTP synthase [Nitrososphaerota archaeon]